MLLPLLLGAGVLLLVASGGKEPSPLEKLRAMKESPAYKVGYKDGYAYGVKYMASGSKLSSMSAKQAEVTPEAKASGDANAYSLGFVTGQNEGANAAAAAKKGTTGTTGTGGTGGTTGTGGGCTTSEAAAMHPLWFYQQALIREGSLAAKNAKGGTNADDSCGPTTQAAIKSFQTKKGLPASGTIDKATAWQLETYVGIASGGGMRPPITYQMARVVDVGLSAGAQYVIGWDEAANAYSALVNATKQSDGFYKITQIVSKSATFDVVVGDRGWLFVQNSDGDWVSTV